MVILMDKFVLITGAFGFLGYHTALKFKREGYQVIGFGLGEITSRQKQTFYKCYFDYLDTNYEHIKALEPEYIIETVYQSCIIKADVVNHDPTEKGERALLNFGHTLGHAVEKLMNFSLYHGECVGLGMICASYISKERGYISEDDYVLIRNMLKKYGFPTRIEGLDIFHS